MIVGAGSVFGMALRRKFLPHNRRVFQLSEKKMGTASLPPPGAHSYILKIEIGAAAMKNINILITVFLFLLTMPCYADQMAITDKGEKVILKSDGTWTFYENKVPKPIIQSSNKTFKKSGNATFLLKSTKTTSAFWVNTDKWSFQKGNQAQSAEYSFKLKDKDVYGMAISEEIEMPLETLADAAIQNARVFAPDINVIHQEIRTVNDIKVIFIEMSGSMKGVKFTYLGYYYANSSGSTQYVFYTANNLMKKYKSEIIEALNGLTQHKIK